MRHRLEIALLLLPLLACARAASPLRNDPAVRCTLLQFAPTHDTAEEAPPWMARFRVVNDLATPIEYQGFSKEDPLFRQEVLRDGKWEIVPVGWCGTGLVAQKIPSGGTLEVSFGVPADGSTYRYRFGEPEIVTEGVRVPN